MSVYAADLLAGRTALVTGGGTGLGKAAAIGLARAGATVVIAARRIDVLEATAEQIHELTGATVLADVVNIRDRETVEALAGRHPAIDILVNNAGGQFPQKARDFSPNGWRSVIDLNLTGTWNMTQVFGNQMLDGNGGTICQVIATVGRGLPGISHTAAARAGILELTRSLAFEWGPKVRINAIAPGQFKTEAWFNTYDEEVGADMASVPLPYPGHPEDLANAVVFLTSPASAYITGEVLYVDGGHTLSGDFSALPPGGYPERKLPPLMR